MEDEPRRVRFLLEYDGTDFSGWQRQPDRRSVQGEIERALSDTVGDAVDVVGAGRTDAGCHARGQVAHADVATRLSAATLARALNARLPDDVRVRAAEDAAPAFHARYDAVARRYDYLLLDGPSVLLRRFALETHGPADATRVRAALAALCGAHDFASFGRPPEGGGTTDCIVYAARWARWLGGPRVSLVANRFLRGMVRTIVGTVLEVGRGRRAPDDIAALLRRGDRARAGPAVPARGLHLVRVSYDPRLQVFAGRSDADDSRRTGGRP